MPETPARSAREELADLTKAVHELADHEVADEIAALREEIAQLRETGGTRQSCCGGHHHCGCAHWHWIQPTWGAAPQYPYITWTSGHTGSSTVRDSYSQTLTSMSTSPGTVTLTNLPASTFYSQTMGSSS